MESETMKIVNHEELKQAIMKHYEVREKGRAMHIWGEPGIGKTYTVNETGKMQADKMSLEFSRDPSDFQGNEKKFVVTSLLASQMDPSDVKGIPSNEKGFTKWLIPNFLPIKGYGILFADELNRAPDLVRSSFYSAIHGGFLGEWVLPKGWMIIAAGNRVDDKVGVFAMEGTLANRFAHYLLERPKTEDWINNFATKHDVDFRIIAYLNWKPSALFKYDPKNKTEAFATPRTWEMASDLIKNDADTSWARAAIGEAIGNDFETFCTLINKYDVEKIISGKQKFPDEDKLGERYAVISAIADWYSGKKDHLEDIFEYSMKIEEEFGMLMITLTKQLGKDKFREHIGDILPKHREVAKRFGRMLY